jgi:hypothetical protein
MGIGDHGNKSKSCLRNPSKRALTCSICTPRELLTYKLKVPVGRAILRQNTEFLAKSSPSIKSEKTLANLVYF